ncbi:proline-rich protein 5-like [Ruditapes philippinarum]|uniref:proline-rich protein 5-like n=1 Tax=Ruditapes philippinarum TaxID=129788 RepID=UPI00295B21CF|nr:proline-rich protein 5-like [Ruditapes philippinarum]
MDILQNGVRTLKRHSISNISEAIRSHIHRDSLGGLGRHLFSPGKSSEIPLKNAEFASVAGAIVQLFQRTKLQENELTILQEAVRNITRSDGPSIYDYYKDRLIKKGMILIREKIKHESAHSLLAHLGEEWNYFYREILPVLQALLYPAQTKSLTIRHIALLEFRDTVLLKLPVKDALSKLTNSEPVPPPIRQMLLVLHGVHEFPCTDNAIELEKLLARVTSPHLGIMGLYSGGSEPDIRSNYKPPEKKISDDTMDADDEIMIDDLRSTMATVSPMGNRLNQKRSSGILHNPMLASVKEHGRGQRRRYSIATT